MLNREEMSMGVLTQSLRNRYQDLLSDFYRLRFSLSGSVANRSVDLSARLTPLGRSIMSRLMCSVSRVQQIPEITKAC